MSACVTSLSSFVPLQPQPRHPPPPPPPPSPNPTPPYLHHNGNGRRQSSTVPAQRSGLRTHALSSTSTTLHQPMGIRRTPATANVLDLSLARRLCWTRAKAYEHCHSLPWHTHHSPSHGTRSPVAKLWLCLVRVSQQPNVCPHIGSLHSGGIWHGREQPIRIPAGCLSPVFTFNERTATPHQF